MDDHDLENGFIMSEYIDSDSSPQPEMPMGFDIQEPMPSLFDVDSSPVSRNSLSESHSSNGPVGTAITAFTSSIDPSVIEKHMKTELDHSFQQSVHSSGGYGGDINTAGSSPMSGDGQIDQSSQLPSHTGDTGLNFKFGNSDFSSFHFGPPGNDMVAELSREASPFSPAMPNHFSPTRQFHGLPAYSFQWPNYGNGGPPAAPVTSMFPANAALYNNAIYSQNPKLKITQSMSKSRVETQITVKLYLSHLPLGITRLHLPTWTIAKSKLLAKSGVDPDQNMLELHVRLVCTSAMTRSDQMKCKALETARLAAKTLRSKPRLPEDEAGEALKAQDGGDVTICQNCILRERKRSGRRKNGPKKIEDEELWRQDEMYRVIVFNAVEVQEWKREDDGQYSVTAPLRITCYCRHHQEKEGFNVIFTLTDHQGNTVAQEMSESIMITDDHKNGDQKNGGAGGHISDAGCHNPQGGLLSPEQMDTAMQHPSPDQPQPQVTPASRVLSRPASPGPIQQHPKKRKTGPSPRVPAELAMTRLNTAPSPSSQLAGQPHSASLTPISSPFATRSPSADMTYLIPSALAPEQSNLLMFGNGSPSPIQNQQQPYASLSGAASINASALYTGPISVHQSRAPSPISQLIAPDPPSALSSPPLAQIFDLGSAVAQAAPPSRAPQILRVIPFEGSTTGNYEVTILGRSFTNSGLTVLFGEEPATTTTYWGSETLVCLVPPQAPGWVQVTIKDQRVQQNQQPVLFHYKESAESEIVRNAFAILSNKFAGKQGDMFSFAKHIVDTNGQGQGGALPGGGMSGAGGIFSSRSTGSKLEDELLSVLEVIDSDKSRRARYNLRTRSTEQTVLHLACYLGFNRFAEALLERGASPLLRDKAGYTPLHMAAWKGNFDMVRLLIDRGADPSLRTLSGSTAADLCKSEAVKEILSCVERHNRARNGRGPLNSHASSAISLQSLSGPLSGAQSDAKDLDSEDETEDEIPEDSSSASFDEAAFSEEEEAEPLLHMRPNTTHVAPLPREANLARRSHRGTDGVGGLEGAVAALKDQMSAQIQALQQSWQLHLQSIPPFPQLSQFPHFPQIANIADQAALIQRLASMVPTIGSDRSGSELNWYHQLMSLAANNAQPAQNPPAYDEVCPPNSLDTKEAAAARAALDAEADAKCAALFDEAESSTRKVEAESSTAKVKVEGAETAEIQEVEELPPVLEIGRKNEITQEQQETLRRAHAEKRKRLSRDKNLFVIWLPLLVVMLALMFYNPLPRFVPSRADFFNTMEGLQTAAAEFMPDRVRAVAT